VVTDRDVDTATVVMISGFEPKTTVAPDGRALAPRVSVQVLLFPLCETETFPKTAVPPGATDTLVGGATVTEPGCAAMTVPIPASIATRAADATVAASRRASSGERLRDDITNQSSRRRSVGSRRDVDPASGSDDGTPLVRAGPAR
jgi:hypothetical protein